MRDLIELLEDQDLLTPNNLLYIQLILTAMNEDELVEKIRDHAVVSNKLEPPLHIEAVARHSGR